MKKKKMKNFRLSENTIGKLEQLCRVHGTSQTETVARAIDMLYDAHKKNGETNERITSNNCPRAN